MANMSYCKFQNTLPDVNDCLDTLRDKSFDELSESERKAAIELVKVCEKITDEFIDEVKKIKK